MAHEPEQVASLRRALGDQLASLRVAAGLSRRQLADAALCHPSLVTHIEKGRRGFGGEPFWRRADPACRANGALLEAYFALEAAKRQHELREYEDERARARVKTELVSARGIAQASLHEANPHEADPDKGATGFEVCGGTDDDDEVEALELARRVAASDVSGTTLTGIELAVDRLAIAYQGTPPRKLLPKVRRHLSYCSQLIDLRMTLAQRRRLLVAGGWLSLLAATVDIDLRRRPTAEIRLATALSLAQQTGHHEITAWCLETQAWYAVTEGDFRRAVDLSQSAQRAAPKNGSAFIQATAQEGRGWARLHDGKATRNTLDRVERLVSTLPQPERPEHHFQYDPAKQLTYTATTLSWLGDPAAEPYAREILHRLETGRDGGPRPRRIAAARLDLALALLAADRPDEAASQAIAAITSRRIVPSNFWRAAEIVAAVEAAGPPEAVDLREAYETLRSEAH
jgi:transcriptional regulator with XRE-family HTH domain